MEGGVQMLTPTIASVRGGRCSILPARPARWKSVDDNEIRVDELIIHRAEARRILVPNCARARRTWAFTLTAAGLVDF